MAALYSIMSRIGVTLLVLVALFTGLARLVVPVVAERYQGVIQEAASQALGMPIGIQRLEARWRGFGPQLRLYDVDLGQLALPEVRIDIALLDSLWQMRPVLGSVSLVQARLRLFRDAADRVHLLDLANADANAEPTAAGKGFSGLPLDRLPLGIGLIDSEVLLHSAKHSLPLHLLHSSLSFVRQGNGFHARGRVQLAGAEGSEIRVNAKIKGPLNDPQKWRGRLYVKTQALELEDVLVAVLDPEQLQINGKLELELWASINEGRVEHLDAALDMRNFAIKRVLEQGVKGYSLEQLQAKGRWHFAEQGWRLQLAGINLERNQARWQEAALSLQGRLADGRLQQLEGAADFLRLEDILTLVSLLPKQEEDGLVRMLQKMQPAGDLRGLSVEASFEGEKPQWAMEGQASEIRTRAFEHFPAIESINGHFIANDGGGILSIDDPDVRLKFEDGLFAEPLRFTQLNTELKWQRFEQGWQIASPLLSLGTADFTSQLRFSLSLPDEGLPHLALVGRLGEAQAVAIGRYLPVGMLKPGVAKWLTEAPKAGRIKGGSLDLIGPLPDFPFDQRATGRFSAKVELEDVTLDYHQGLPLLQEAVGQLEFHNASFRADINRARIAKGQVTQAQVRIASLHPATPLEVSGEVTGALFENIRSLKATSLANYLGEAADRLQGSGEARFELQLALPLGPGHPQASIQGQLFLHKNQIELPEWQLKLEDAEGLLRFDEQGLSSNDLRARAFDSQIELQVNTPKTGPKRTEVISSGQFPIQTMVRRRLGLELPLLQGSARWRLHLDIPHQSLGPETHPTLTLSSDLKGVGIPLPAPFGKAAGEARPLSIQIQPPVKGEATQVLASFGKEIKARLELTQDAKGLHLSRGEVRLGGAEAEAPSLPGLSLKGHLTELQLDALLKALDDKGQMQPGQWPNLDLELGLLKYRDVKLNRLRIKGGPRGNAWVGSLESPEVQGLVQLPANLKQEPITLELERISLGGLGEGTSQGPPSTVNPQGFPGISLRCNHLLMNKEDLGRLDIQARPNAQGLRFEQFRINSEWFSLEGQGNWQGGKASATTDVNLKLQITDLGRLQKAMGDKPDIARSGGTLEGKLNWPGSPLDFGRMELSGNLKLKVGKGSLLDVEPGAGRIFGLLNLGSIHRRLSLDFADFLGKGFAFDKIEGDVELRQGNALTNNLTMAAPGGDLKFYGRTGLQKRDIDQIVELYPEISGTLASAGGFVAGPVVGVGLLIVNKIIGKHLNKIGLVRYKVQGDWKDPKVTRLTEGGTSQAPELDQLQSQPQTTPSTAPKPRVQHKTPSFLDP